MGVSWEKSVNGNVNWNVIGNNAARTGRGFCASLFPSLFYRHQREARPSAMMSLCEALKQPQ
jgi:hypothetical protein